MTISAEKLPEFVSLVRKFESNDTALREAFWGLISRDPSVIFTLGMKAYFKTSPYLDGCAIGYRGVNEADYKIINDFASQGKKVEAIKHLRAVTGSGLKDAKDAVEEWFPFPYFHR